jgi:hypothetical protein
VNSAFTKSSVPKSSFTIDTLALGVELWVLVPTPTESAVFGSKGIEKSAIFFFIVNAEFTPDALEEQLITYLEDNLIEASGIHAQLGLRFKVLIADAHLNFRYNIAEDVYDGSDSFTEIQFKLGIGF